MWNHASPRIRATTGWRHSMAGLFASHIRQQQTARSLGSATMEPAHSSRARTAPCAATPWETLQARSRRSAAHRYDHEVLTTKARGKWRRTSLGGWLVLYAHSFFRVQEQINSITRVPKQHRQVQGGGDYSKGFLLGHGTVEMSDDYAHSSGESGPRAVQSIAD